MAWKIVNNADSGTSTTFGGNDGDKISQLFSGITIADIPDINTNFRFRDDRFRLRNPANTFDYIFSTGAIDADRTLNVPLITGTDTLAVLGLAQTFSNKVLDATCTFSGSIALPPTVVETDQANTYGDFTQKFKDNRIEIENPAGTFTYRIIGQAIAGNRDLNLPLTTATDTLAAIGINNNFTNGQTIIAATGSADAVTLRRTDTGVPGTGIDLNYEFNDSLGNNDQFCDLRASVVTQTSGAEDAKWQVNLMYAGTKMERFRVEEDGHVHIIGPAADLLTLYDSATTNDAYGGNLLWRGQDSVGNDQTYLEIKPYIQDWTSGSEDSNMAIHMMKGGVLENTHWFSEESIGIQNTTSNNWGYIDVNNIQNSDKTFYLPNCSANLVGAGFSAGGDVVVSNTVTETTLLSYSIPQDSLMNDGFCRVVLRGHILQNQATGTTFTFRVKIAGSTVWGDVTASIGQNATRLPFRLEFDVYARSSTTSTAVNGFLMLNDGAAAGTAGIGDISDDEGFVNQCFDSEGNGYTGDMGTSNRTLTVTIEQSVASTSVVTTLKHSSVEQISA